MRVRLLAFAIWAVVAACVMFWALRLLVPTRPLPPHALVSGTPAPPRGDLGRVFGAAPAPSVPGAPVAVESSQATRFKLLGVAAPRQGGDRNGLALIAIDGKPARSFAVGAVIDGDMVLQAVHPRGAKLGVKGAPPQVSLDLPALPPPTTGSLPLMPAIAPTSPAAAAMAPGTAGTAPAPVVAPSGVATPQASGAQAPVDLPLPPPPLSASRVNPRQ